MPQAAWPCRMPGCACSQLLASYFACWVKNSLFWVWGWPFWPSSGETLLYNRRWSVVMTRTHANYQGHRSGSLKVKTNMCEFYTVLANAVGNQSPWSSCHYTCACCSLPVYSWTGGCSNVTKFRQIKNMFSQKLHCNLLCGCPMNAHRQADTLVTSDDWLKPANWSLLVTWLLIWTIHVCT